jgi:hypothetical protein
MPGLAICAVTAIAGCAVPQEADLLPKEKRMLMVAPLLLVQAHVEPLLPIALRSSTGAALGSNDGSVTF